MVGLGGSEVHKGYQSGHYAMGAMKHRTDEFQKICLVEV